MGEREVLLALAERCEQATGPDSRLNADIFAALNSEWTHHQSGGDLFWRGSPYAPKTMRAPHFTSSLDAAWTLAPRGCEARVTCFRNGRGGAIVTRSITWGPDDGVTMWMAATPPLALCVAALRALAAEAADE